MCIQRAAVRGVCMSPGKCWSLTHSKWAGHTAEEQDCSFLTKGRLSLALVPMFAGSHWERRWRSSPDPFGTGLSKSPLPAVVM